MPLQQEPEVDSREALVDELAGMLDAKPAKSLKRNPLRRDQTKEQRAVGELAKQKLARDIDDLFPARESTAGEKVSIGATESFADIAKAPELADKAARALGVPMDLLERHIPVLKLAALAHREFAAFGDKLHQAAREAEPYPSQDFKSQALRGLGSTAPFAVAGPLGGKILVGLVGGAQSAVPLFEDVLAETGDEKKAWVGAAVGFGLGLTEAAGVGGILANLDRASAGTFKRALLRTAAESSEEALQEWLQAGGQDIARKALTGRQIKLLQTLEAQGQAGAIGALLGAAVSGGAEAASQGLGRLPGQPQQVAGSEGELTPEDVFAEDVKGALALQRPPWSKLGKARTVADISSKTAPGATGTIGPSTETIAPATGPTEAPTETKPAKGETKEPATEEEAAQAIAEGKPLDLETLRAFPGAVAKAAEIVHAPPLEPTTPEPPPLALGEKAAQENAAPASGSGVPTERRQVEPKVEDLDAEEGLKLIARQIQRHVAGQIDPTLLEQADTDPLTGLANRRGDAAQFERIRKVARRKGDRLVRMFGDLDNFKAVNTAFGDEGGDRAIKIVADAWRKAAEEGNGVLPARKGGDEFVTTIRVSKDADVDAIRDQMEEIAAKALADAGMGEAMGKKIAASIGWVEAVEGEDLNELTKRAAVEAKKRKTARGVSKTSATGERTEGAVAQPAERPIPNREAEGSIPSPLAKPEPTLQERIDAIYHRGEEARQKDPVFGDESVADAIRRIGLQGELNRLRDEQKRKTKGLHSEEAKAKRAARKKPVEAEEPTYGVEHRPNEDGPPAHDLLSGDLAPRDIYERPTDYTGFEGPLLKATLSTLTNARGKPTAEITVYRAGPRRELHRGDWITLARGYALNEREKGDKVHTFKVQARDVRWAGDDLMEWGYFPETAIERKIQETKKVAAEKPETAEQARIRAEMEGEKPKHSAYKGYLVKQASTSGPRDTFIEKDGQLIGWANDVADARRIIDELTAAAPSVPQVAVDQAKAELDTDALKIDLDDNGEDDATGGVVADPGDLPSSMQGGRQPDPGVGGGVAPRAPIGDRMYGRLEIDPGAPKAGERVSAPQVIEQLSKVVAASGGKTPIRWGRMGRVKARGFFRVAPEVIRVKTANSIATAAHEVGHALEKHVFGWEKGGPWVKPIASKAMQDELVKLGRALYGDTRPAAGYKREGFAEFIRLFVADHAKAAKDAPQFTAWFESEFAKAQPEVMTELLETRRLVTRWGEQGSLERAKASTIDPASWGERWKKLKARTTLFAFKRAWTEIGEAYHVFARESERKLGRLLEPTEDPFMLFQAFRMTHSARVRRMVSSGMIDLWGNRTGPALDEIRSLVRGRFEDFSIFLWAKRAHALWNDPLNGERNPGLSREDALQIIADLSTPHFELAADKVYQWQDGLLSYAAQASPSFRKVVDRVREVDPGAYIPLQREFDALDSLWNETRSKTARYSGGGIVSALKGSGRRIKNPIQAMLANAERTVLAAHRRLILDATIKLGQIEGMGHMIEEVPKDQVPFTVDLEQVLKRLATEKPGTLAEGIEGPLAVGDFAGEALTFFAPAQFPKGQDPVIPFWDGKQVRWYWVDHRLASALAGLDLARLPKVIDILLGIPNRLFRAGTTGLRASFGLITNPIRDAPTFWINTRSRAWAPQLLGRYYAEFTKAAGAAVTGGKYESPYLEAFMNLGGAMATPLGPDSQEVQRAARELVQTGKWRYLDPRNWFEFYKDLVQFPETGTRAAELRNIAAEVGWRPGEPMSPNQALQMLLGAKQVTADFTAAGAIARVANQVAPFVGASIAGNRAAVRSAKRNPARYFFRGMQMAAATLLLWWQVKDEEWYIELKARSKFMFWHVPMRWQGRDEIVAVPRPFEIGAIFAALPEALADAWYRQEPEIASKWFAQFFETLNPLSLPAPIEEAAEQLANRDFFWDTPIVPTGELRRNPEEQVGDYTSRVAMFLGELFGASPRRIDHAIKGTMGGVAEDVVSVLGLGPTEKEREKEPADAHVIGRLFKRGGPLGTSPQSVDDLYETLEEAQAIQASKKRAETPEERNRRLLLEDAAEATSALGYVRTQTKGVDQRRKITEEIVKVARDALEEAAGAGRRGFAKAALGSAKARKKQAQSEQR